MPIVSKYPGDSLVCWSRLFRRPDGPVSPKVAQWQLADQCSRRHSRLRFHLFEQRREELTPLRSGRVSISLDTDLAGEKTWGGEAQVHRRQLCQAADQQTRAHQQSDGDRDLHDDIRTLQPPATCAVGDEPR